MKKIISTILAIALIVSSVGIAFAKEPSVCNYVSLGASNTNGYGLHGYLPEEGYVDPEIRNTLNGLTGISGYLNEVQGSYPSLFREYLETKYDEVNLYQLAQSSMRVEELRLLLDEDFTADAFAKWRFYDEDNNDGWWNDGVLDIMRTEYKARISDAHIITYDLGLNNFGVYIINALFDGTMASDISIVIGDEYASRYTALRNQVKESAADLSLGLVTEEEFESIEPIIDVFAYALLGYCVNFDYTMEAINDLNDDAEIFVFGIQNVLEGMTMSSNGIVFPIGELYGTLVNMANAYMSVYSSHADEYTYLPVGAEGRVEFFVDQLKNWNESTEVDSNMKDCYDVYDTELFIRLKFRVAAKVAGIEYNRSVTKNAVNICETNHAEAYEAALYNAYYAVNKYFKQLAMENNLAIDSINLDEFDALDDRLYDIEQTIIDTIVNSSVDETLGCEEVYASASPYIDEIMEDDALRSLAVLYMRSLIGNTFFTHPNLEGHKTQFNKLKLEFDKFYAEKMQQEIAIAGFSFVIDVSSILANTMVKINTTIFNNFVQPIIKTIFGR